MAIGRVDAGADRLTQAAVGAHDAERVVAAERRVSPDEREARVDPERVAGAARLLDVVEPHVDAASERVRAVNPAHIVEELEFGRLAAGAGPVDERAGEDAARPADLVGARVFGIGEIEHVAREPAVISFSR